MTQECPHNLTSCEIPEKCTTTAAHQTLVAVRGHRQRSQSAEAESAKWLGIDDLSLQDWENGQTEPCEKIMPGLSRQGPDCSGCT